MIALQVAQQSPLTYLQKFASQPVPQLPTPEVVQQKFLPTSAQHAPTSGSQPAGQSQQDGSKGSLDTAPAAGAYKALQLPLLRPAPPVLKPFAGIQTALHAAQLTDLPPHRQWLKHGLSALAARTVLTYNVEHNNGFKGV